MDVTDESAAGNWGREAARGRQKTPRLGLSQMRAVIVGKEAFRILGSAITVFRRGLCSDLRHRDVHFVVVEVFQ